MIELQVFAKDLEGPSCIGLDSKRNCILLPQLTLNKLVVLPLDK